MLNINITPELQSVAPQYVGGFLEAEVVNGPTPAALWQEIEACSEQLRAAFDTTTIKQQAGIAATRAAYKAAGKDPSRYRPSCEQLARRVLQGKSLFSIDTLVDLGNLVSLACGCSTAVLDREKIVGDTISLGLGRPEEPYEAIGRGQLNIADLPVFRDADGAFATPTSDSVRTMCTEATTKVLIIINGYDGDAEKVKQALEHTWQLLTRYAKGSGEARIVLTAQTPSA